MRLVLPLVLLVGLLIATIALDAPEPPAELTVAYIAIQTLDPTQMQSSEDIRFGYALFEGLCTFDPYTFTVQPGVAESWQVSEDGLTYKFQLRKDAKWSNGDPVTAHDFVTTWRQSMLPDFASEYHKYLMHIRGGRAYFEWASEQLQRANDQPNAELADQIARDRIADYPEKFDELVGVRALNNHTLVVELESYVPYFFEIVACWPLFPLHESVTRNVEYDPQTRMLRRPKDYTKANRLVSNGPYRLSGWRLKRSIRLQANEHYWNRRPKMPQSVEAVCFADNHAAAYNAYHTGAIDLYLGAVPPFRADILQAAQAGRRNDVLVTNNWGTYFYSFNCRKTLPDGRPNPFADHRVRQAFAMLIDKQAIVRDVTRLNQQVARTFIPPDSLDGYESPEGLACIGDARTDDQRQAFIERARELLAEAGYESMSTFPTIEFMYNTGGGHGDTAQAVALMWNRTLDVNVSFKTHEWKIFLDQYSAGNFMIARASWFGDYGDPTTFLDLFKTDNGNNDTGFSHPQYDALLELAAVNTDPETRFDLLERAEALVMNQQMPIVPIYHYRLIHLFDPERISGVSEHPRNIQMFQHIEVTP